MGNQIDKIEENLEEIADTFFTYLVRKNTPYLI